MIKLTLPYPPSVNHYWIQTGRRKTIGAKGIAYRNAVFYAIAPQHRRMGTTKRLKVVIHATMPDKRKRDIDNLPKAILDGIQNTGLYIDDNQIDELTIIRGMVKKPGSIQVEIYEVDGFD